MLKLALAFGAGFLAAKFMGDTAPAPVAPSVPVGGGILNSLIHTPGLQGYGTAMPLDVLQALQRSVNSNRSVASQLRGR